MGITKSASCIISLDIDKLTNPLLPMMPVNVVEPTVDTEHHHNVDTLTDSNTKNNPVSITQSDSDDRLAGTEENAAIESENNESSSQDERQRTDDTLSSEHSEIPINVPS